MYMQHVHIKVICAISAECRGFESHLRQLIFIFSFASGIFHFLSILSFIIYMHMYMYSVHRYYIYMKCMLHVHVCVQKWHMLHVHVAVLHVPYMYILHTVYAMCTKEPYARVLHVQCTCTYSVEKRHVL